MSAGSGIVGRRRSSDRETKRTHGHTCAVALSKGWSFRDYAWPVFVNADPGTVPGVQWFLRAAGPLVTSGGSVRDPVFPVPAHFRIVTYNLHGPPEDRMDDLVEVLAGDSALKDAMVLGLQEVNRHHRKTAYRDVACELANALGMYYAFAVENPYKNGGGERGLAILSRFPMSQVERVALPHAGPGGRRRIALGTTLHLGPNRLRMYSIHLETRIANRNARIS